MTQSDEEKNMERFLSWLNANGATFPTVKIDTVGGLRGLYATRNIRCGELIFHIPRHLMVTTEMAESSPIGQRIAGQNKFVTYVAYLTAFLIENQREKGFWEPYVDVLPREFFSFFGFHRPLHRELLRGSTLQSEELTDLAPGTGLRTTMLEEYAIIKPLFENLDLRKFSTIFQLVANRTFDLKVDERDTHAIIPFADMPNHTVPPQAKWFGDASRGFCATAVQDVACGEQVHISYGFKSNAALLLSYGFCIDDNRYDSLKLALPDIKPTHPFFAKTQKWGEKRGRNRLFTVSMNHQALNARQMLAYLRMATLEDMPALQEGIRSFSDKENEVLGEISQQNELAARQALAGACQRSLALFDRTQEEDEQLLADPDLEWMARCAIMVGQGEKRILKHYLDFANAYPGSADTDAPVKH